MVYLDADTSCLLTALLLAQALAAIFLRVYSRIVLGKRACQLSDYIIIVAWLAGLAWVIVTNSSTQIEESTDEDDEITWMKLLFAGYYLFELGLYLPKASILAFYWNLFPETSRNLRLALYVSVGYTTAAFLVTLFVLTFWCSPTSRNWSLDNSDCALWSAYVWKPFYINYAMNLSTDLLVFFLPFLVLRESHFHRSQKISLIVIFCLGAITIAVSVTRFTWVALELGTHSGDVLCIAELSVAITVVSLPHMKPLLSKWFQQSLKSFGSSKNKIITLQGTDSLAKL